jgi:hypothetical protein
VSVTAKALCEYEMAAETRLFAASRSMTVEAVKLAESSGSENTAIGATSAETPVAPAAGVTETTCGGKGLELLNTTSTQ